MRRRAAALLAALVLAGVAAAAAFLIAPREDAAALADCRHPGFAWSEGEPPINRRHVFCGEVRDGEPKGFHSTALRPTTDLIVAIDARGSGRDGIYQAIAQFSNGRRKFSTFFPDRCTVAEVTRSIAHAAAHPARRHPVWGEIGPSAPADAAPGYCLDDRGRVFEIRFSRQKSGRINTAFPQLTHAETSLER